MRLTFIAHSLVAVLILVGCTATQQQPATQEPDARPTPTIEARIDIGPPQPPTEIPAPTPQPTNEPQPKIDILPIPDPMPYVHTYPTLSPPPDPSPIAEPTPSPAPTPTAAPVSTPEPTATPAPTDTPATALTTDLPPTPAAGPAAAIIPGPVPSPTARPQPTPPQEPEILPRTGNRVSDGNVDLLEYGYPEVAETMARIPWVGDGISTEEEAAYNALLTVAFKITDKALVDRVFDMPFLQSLEPEDLKVLKLLSNAGEGPGSHLMNILDHPTVREGGITQQQLPRVIPLNEWDLRSAGLVDFMLDPEKTYLDSRTITTDLGTQVSLHIIREPKYLATGMMDHLALSVNRVEQMMNLPLPEGQVILTVADILQEGFGGRHYDNFIAVAPHRVEGPSLDRIIAHEVAHIFWTDSVRWVNEGMAQVMEHMVVSEARGQAFAPVGYACTYYSNLRELEKARPQKGQPQFYCNYDLGERLFQSLRLALGDEAFLEAARQFYLLLNADEGPPLLDRAKEAFGHPDIIDDWYQGENQESPAPPDTSEPSLEFTELGTRILFTGITVESEWQSGGTIPEIFGFSASDPPEQLYLAIFHRSEDRATEDTYVDYVLELSYEDGFVYERRERFFRTWAGSRNSRSRTNIGRFVDEWKPGVHTATVYDLKGVKIAEASWTVRP